MSNPFPVPQHELCLGPRRRYRTADAGGKRTTAKFVKQASSDWMVSVVRPGGLAIAWSGIAKVRSGSCTRYPSSAKRVKLETALKIVKKMPIDRQQAQIARQFGNNMLRPEFLK